MPGLQPLLHVDKALVLVVDQLVLGQLGRLVVQVRDEPLEEHVLFLEVLVDGQRIGGIADDVVLLASRVVDVVNLLGLSIGGHQGLVVKVDPVLSVVDQVAKAVLLGVVDRGQHVDLVLLLLLYLDWGWLGLPGLLELSVENISGRVHAVQLRLVAICVAVQVYLQLLLAKVLRLEPVCRLDLDEGGRRFVRLGGLEVGDGGQRLHGDVLGKVLVVEERVFEHLLDGQSLLRVKH